MKKAVVVLLVIAVVIGAIIFLSGGEDEAEMGPDVLLMVNGEPVRTSDVQWAWAMLPEEEKDNYRGPEGFRELLNEMIVWKMMAQQAEEKGLNKDPQVERRVENFRENMLVNALINQTITEEDIFNYFQNNYMHAIFIMVRFPEDPTKAEIEDTKELADKIYSEIETPEDFKKVGEEYTNKYERVRIGDMGYLTKEDVAGQAGLPAAEVLFGLKTPGEFSGPVKSKEGFFIFMALEPPQNLNPRGMSPRLRQKLMDVKRDEIIRSYANQFKTATDVKIEKNERAIEDLVETLSSQWESQGSPSGAPGRAAGAGEMLEDISEAVGDTAEGAQTTP